RHTRCYRDWSSDVCSSDLWQDDLISSKIVSEGPVGVGARATDTRKVPGGPRDMTYEITQHDPPHKSSWQGLDGPVRGAGSVSVEDRKSVVEGRGGGSVGGG